MPISDYADFKRYTRDQFREADQRALAALVERLAARGCEVVVTNANAPLVHALYGAYAITVVPTRRNVNARGDRRTGEDVIIHVPAR